MGKIANLRRHLRKSRNPAGALVKYFENSEIILFIRSALCGNLVDQDVASLDVLDLASRAVLQFAKILKNFPFLFRWRDLASDLDHTKIRM